MLKQRIIGAVVLVSLVVIFVPLLLNGSHYATGVIPTPPSDTLEFKLVPGAEPGDATPGAGPGPARPPEAGPPYSWMVQVGMFSNEANAAALRDALRAKHFPTFVDKAAGPEGELWRVRVGPELTAAAAEALGARLNQATGLATLVVRLP